jgi:hypothetical protein
MIQKEMIRMVDSMVVVEDREEHEHGHRGRHNVVLEESVILKAPHRR